MEINKSIADKVISIDIDNYTKETNRTKISSLDKKPMITYGLNQEDILSLASRVDKPIISFPPQMTILSLVADQIRSIDNLSDLVDAGFDNHLDVIYGQHTEEEDVVKKQSDLFKTLAKAKENDITQETTLHFDNTYSELLKEETTLVIQNIGEDLDITALVIVTDEKNGDVLRDTFKDNHSIDILSPNDISRELNSWSMATEINTEKLIRNISQSLEGKEQRINNKIVLAQSENQTERAKQKQSDLEH